MVPLQGLAGDGDSAGGAGAAPTNAASPESPGAGAVIQPGPAASQIIVGFPDKPEFMLELADRIEEIEVAMTYSWLRQDPARVHSLFQSIRRAFQNKVRLYEWAKNHFAATRRAYSYSYYISFAVARILPPVIAYSLTGDFLVSLGYSFSPLSPIIFYGTRLSRNSLLRSRVLKDLGKIESPRQLDAFKTMLIGYKEQQQVLSLLVKGLEEDGQLVRIPVVTGRQGKNPRAGLEISMLESIMNENLNGESRKYLEQMVFDLRSLSQVEYAALMISYIMEHPPLMERLIEELRKAYHSRMQSDSLTEARQRLDPIFDLNRSAAALSIAMINAHADISGRSDLLTKLGPEGKGLIGTALREVFEFHVVAETFAARVLSYEHLIYNGKRRNSATEANFGRVRGQLEGIYSTLETTTEVMREDLGTDREDLNAAKAHAIMESLKQIEKTKYGEDGEFFQYVELICESLTETVTDTLTAIQEAVGSQ